MTATERGRRWRAANPEKAREQTRRWRQANPEWKRDHDRQWREQNPEGRRAIRKRWEAAHPERRRELAHQRRARLHNATIGDIPRDAEQQLLGYQGGRCAYCHVDLAVTGHHVDHVVPIARGGAHAWDNLVLACPPCNQSKSARLVDEWLGEAA